MGATRMVMWVSFYHWHARDTMIILEEGNLTHKQCSRCEMMVPWRDLNGRHLNTSQCNNGAYRKRSRVVEEDLRESAERHFQDMVERSRRIPPLNIWGKS